MCDMRMSITTYTHTVRRALVLGNILLPLPKRRLIFVHIVIAHCPIKALEQKKQKIMIMECGTNEGRCELRAQITPFAHTRDECCL